ncbi:MAG TPA: N-acyl homoserine lactonase family protein [Puia sp.]|jgi:glyoxylase-like metal-dependent hydrolase (beta-lactamase superfamily II)|nr:N-acyl homoserine lactonase family protein [Puia sp.]
MKKGVLLIPMVLLGLLQGQAQPGHYKVYAIRFASMAHPTAISMWTDKGPEKDSVKIDFSIWLIRGDNGKNVLVDAGFQNDIGEAKDFEVVNYIRPDSVLAKVGLKAADITDIVLSHPHWDHIDGVGLFPNAHVWIQKEDYNYFVGAAWASDSTSGGFDKRDVRKMVELNMAGKVTLVDGDNKEIIPGITVFTGSRHTFNSQYVLVRSGDKKIILASDNIWIYYSLEHMVPASVGGTLDPAGYVRSMARMKTLASSPKYIIPGHDAKVYTLFPVVTEGVVEIK